MIYIPAGVVFPLGCPEVSHLDPRSEKAGVVLPEMRSFALWRGDLRSFWISPERSCLVLLDLGISEAQICPVINDVALVGARALGKGGVSGVRCLVICEVALWWDE